MLDPEDPRPVESGRMPEITEENLVDSQARVRAQLVKRYELMWSVIEARISEDRDEVRPLDPRLLEIGKGILKEEAVLYRLTKAPAVQEEEAETPIPLDERRALVASALDELEAKRNAQREAREQREQAG
jgi:hypothetical protein